MQTRNYVLHLLAAGMRVKLTCRTNGELACDFDNTLLHTTAVSYMAIAHTIPNGWPVCEFDSQTGGRYMRYHCIMFNRAKVNQHFTRRFS